MGLGDVKSLSEIILNALSLGQDIGMFLSYIIAYSNNSGNSQVLQQYASDRYLKNCIMLTVTDKLYSLYSTNNPFIVGLRSIGLNSINQFNWIKKILINEVSTKL